MPAVIEALGARSNGKPRLLLIDEADKFVATDADDGYPILYAFRNLIAITCNELLTELDPRTRLIEAPAVDRALASGDTQDALGGWQHLVTDEHAARLDRIIIYTMAGRETFKRSELLEALREQGIAPRPEDVQFSLQRLDLAFILGREGERFRFRVPLFRRMVMEEAVYLEDEVREFKRHQA